jgi:hypothetical protein
LSLLPHARKNRQNHHKISLSWKRRESMVQ